MRLLAFVACLGMSSLSIADPVNIEYSYADFVAVGYSETGAFGTAESNVSREDALRNLERRYGRVFPVFEAGPECCALVRSFRFGYDRFVMSAECAENEKKARRKARNRCEAYAMNQHTVNVECYTNLVYCSR